MTTKKKPKLLFFQRRYEPNVPEFIQIQIREHIKCLAYFFDTVVINKDCDYQQVYDAHQPDLALFESGPNLENCHRLNIKNVKNFDAIPKLGLFNADAWDATRAGMISEMDHLGIEHFFSISITASEHMPNLAENLYSWPNFINPEVYKNYGLTKTIPVLISGAQSTLYPWRNKVNKLISKHYPHLFCPHPGYYRSHNTARMMFGEKYAQTINASWFAPSCGTIAKEFVRKHLEIPACKTCLITEKTPGLEAAGFVDMVNCVFADEHDVLDKLDDLFQDTEKRDQIIKAGFDLVHSRHAYKQRNQILAWHQLNQRLKPGQAIIQPNPFEAPVLTENKPDNPAYIISKGLHLSLLYEGDKNFQAGNYSQAEMDYMKCLNYTRMLPEAKLRLAICNLYQGHPKNALAWIKEPIQHTLAGYKSKDPDPVEWSWYIITLMATGNLSSAAEQALEFPNLRHVMLDHTRMLVDCLKNNLQPDPFHLVEGNNNRKSIHVIEPLNLDDWILEICKILSACKQDDLADRSAALFIKKKVSAINCLPINKKKRPISNKKNTSQFALINITSTIFNFLLAKTCKKAIVLFKFSQKWHHIIRRLEDIIFYTGDIAERKFGYFLPYHISTARKDDLYQLIEELAKNQDISKILVIGYHAKELTVQALLTGVGNNQNKKIIYTQPSYTEYSQIGNDIDVASAEKIDNFNQKLDKFKYKTINDITSDNNPYYFDLILINQINLNGSDELINLSKDESVVARHIIINNLISPYNHKIKNKFLEDKRYLLTQYNPEHRKGYAIFELISKQ